LAFQLFYPILFGGNVKDGPSNDGAYPAIPRFATLYLPYIDNVPKKQLKIKKRPHKNDYKINNAKKSKIVNYYNLKIDLLEIL